MRGMRSFIGWHKVPEFELPVDNWLCKKMEKLNLTITEGYLQETQKLLASSKINSSSLPGRPDGMGCMLRRETVTMLLYLPGLRNRPSLTVLLAGLPEPPFLLPHPPGHSARTCLGIGREQPENKLS